MIQFIIRKMCLYIFIASTFTFCDSSKQTGNRTIQLKNTASIPLTDKAIIIPRTELGDIPAGSFPLVTRKNGDTIPAQLDELNGDDQWDEVFLLLTWMPARKKVYTSVG
jgi:hypothetical protein